MPATGNADVLTCGTWRKKKKWKDWVIRLFSNSLEGPFPPR
jgi:hypothetical protein